MSRKMSAKVYANFSGGLVTESNELQAPDNSVTSINNFNIKQNGSVEVRPGLEFDSSPAITNIPLNGFSITDTATNVFEWEAVNGDPLVNLAVIQVGRVLYFYSIEGGKIVTDAPYAEPLPLSAYDTAYDNNINKLPMQAVSGGGRFYVVGKYLNPSVLSVIDSNTAVSGKRVIAKDINLKVRDFGLAGEGELINGMDYDDKEQVGFGSSPWLSLPYSNKKLSLSGESEYQRYMSGAHAYNLLNQGWPAAEEDDDYVIPQVSTDNQGYARVGEGDTIITDSPDGSLQTNNYAGAALRRSNVRRFPSVYEPFHSLQNGGGTTVSKQKAFQPSFMRTTYAGNTLAPTGHFVKDAFNIERKAIGLFSEYLSNPVSTVDAWYAANYPEMVENIKYDYVDKCETRPDSIAFYAGRAWYAGQDGEGFNRNIYFSQVVGDDTAKAEKCYQAADPTAEDINELVATDGGVLSIEGMGQVHKILPIGPSLMVVASNGVWAISGSSEGANFTATSYSVRKITSQGAISKASIVEARDSVIYWSDASINMLSFDALGAISMQDISSEKIRSHYAEIKDYLKGAGYSKYDEGADNVIWFYSDQAPEQEDPLIGKRVNSALVLNVSTGAYSNISMTTTSSIVPVAVVATEASSSIVNTDTVTDDAEVPVTADGIAVTANTTTIVPGRTSLKLLTMQASGNPSIPWNYRFSEFTDVDTFTDWGEPYAAYLEAGFDSLGDVITESKKAPMFVAHMKNTEKGFSGINGSNTDLSFTTPSSCLISYSWDWGSRDYKNQFQAYRHLKNYTPENTEDSFEYLRDVVTTKTRLRGRGMSLGVRVDAESGKDLKLLGYGIVYTTGGGK